jgi:hypothetical protein
MRRLLSLAIGLALAAPACTGDGGANGSPSPSVVPTATTPSDTASPDPTSTSAPRPIPPAWAEPIEQDLDPAAITDERLVPPGATLTARVVLAEGGGLPEQVVVAYVVGSDPFAAEHGVAVWERFPDPPAWSVVLAYVDKPAAEVLGIRLQTGDLTGDLHEDVLAFEDMGGTGGCGRWRVLAASAAGTETVFQEQTCDTQVSIVGETLEVRGAIFEPEDPHCCPSAFRTSTLEWDGQGFTETSSRVDDAPSG